MRRNSDDWEMEEFLGFMDQLKNFSPRPHENDEWVWSNHRKGKFTVKSSCSMLENASGDPYPYKSIRCLGSPLKVAYS